MRSNPSLERIPFFIALGSTALHVTLSLSPAARDVVARVRTAVALRGESALAARRRTFGSAYADGIEALKRSIPRGGEYLLVEAVPNGQHYFVRYDLAPRRAWPLGALVQDGIDIRTRGRPVSAPRLTVVTRGDGEAPLLVTTEEFFLGVPLPR